MAPAPGIALSDDQRLAWLRLIRSENVGPQGFRDLINHFGTASAAIDAVPELAARGGGRKLRLTSADDAARELERVNRSGGWMLCMGEPDYPAALRAGDGPPPVLTGRGDKAVLRRDFVGFVGSRNASMSGVKFTRQLAEETGRAGYGIVSGLARGIDSAAHEASLETGTVAAFAGGIDVIYPPQNDKLVGAIIDKGGAVITEMPLGHKPRAKDFPRRNRIVAGMSLGLVVVEAARRSGSLISARLANEMGRQVFAVPGSPLDPRSEGANHLIREGARLITCAADIMDDLRPLSAGHQQSAFTLAEDGAEALRLEEPSESDRERLVRAIGHTPCDVDELIAFTGIAPGALQMLLLELDLAGQLERHAGNRVSLVQA